MSSSWWAPRRHALWLRLAGRTGLAVMLWYVAGAVQPLQAQAFDKGKEAYLFDRPAEAVVYLEQALAEAPDNYLAYLYLGIAFQQLGRHEKALATFQAALDRQLGEPQVLLFNMGNTSLLAGDANRARTAYERAIALAPGFGLPYVNLGNLEVQQANYPVAIERYRQFIGVMPEDPKVPEVVKMISLLQDELAARELAQKAEEERQKAEALKKEEEDRQKKAREEEAERQRLAKEEETRKAEARRKQLMDSVFDNLNDLTGSGETLSAGGETVMESTDNLERED